MHVGHPLRAKYHYSRFCSENVQPTQTGNWRNQHWLARLEDLPAGDGPCRERVCQTPDDGMSEALIGHAVFNIGNMIAQLFGEIVHATDHHVGVNVQFFPQVPPVVKTDVALTPPFPPMGRRSCSRRRETVISKSIP